MDDALYFMLHGCNLANRLEPNLQNLQPDELSSSCQEIISVFTTALDCLNRDNHGGTIELRGLRGDQREQIIPEAAVTFPNELTETMNQAVMNIWDLDPLPDLKQSPEGKTVGPSSGGAGLLIRQGSKKRRGFDERNTIRIPAPPIGRSEALPDDGDTWRKYGQKEILGTKYPRSYYSCTHKTFYGCDAKKQMQRMDADPYMYEITYCNSHTCQTPAHISVNPSIRSVEPDRL